MMSFIRTLCAVVTILVTISAPAAYAAEESAKAGKPTWGERFAHPIRWAKGELNRSPEATEEVELPDLGWLMPYKVWPLILLVVASLLLGTHALRRKHGQLIGQHALLLGLGVGALWVLGAFMLRGSLAEIVEVLAAASLVPLGVVAYREKFLRWWRFYKGIRLRHGLRVAWALGNIKRLATGLLPVPQGGLPPAPPVAIPPVGANCTRCGRPFLPGARGCAFCPGLAPPVAPQPGPPRPLPQARPPRRGYPLPTARGRGER